MDALFEADEFEPVKVKVIRCAACIGGGKTLMSDTCPRCDGIGRLGSSFWRGKEWLHDILAVAA